MEKIYHPSYGLLNSFLGMLGLESWQREWLGDTETALIAVFIPIVWQYIGNHMLMMYSAIKGVPNELLEAACIDGASYLQTCFLVTIPMIKDMIIVCVTFAIVGSLKVFDLVYVMTNGGPLHATEVPGTLMYSAIFKKPIRIRKRDRGIHCARMRALYLCVPLVDESSVRGRQRNKTSRRKGALK